MSHFPHHEVQKWELFRGQSLKAQNYQDALQEMHLRIDKGRQAGSGLWWAEQRYLDQIAPSECVNPDLFDTFQYRYQLYARPPPIQCEPCCLAEVSDQTFPIRYNVKRMAVDKIFGMKAADPAYHCRPVYGCFPDVAEKKVNCSKNNKLSISQDSSAGLIDQMSCLQRPSKERPISKSNRARGNAVVKCPQSSAFEASHRNNWTRGSYHDVQGELTQRQNIRYVNQYDRCKSHNPNVNSAGQVATGRPISGKLLKPVVGSPACSSSISSCGSISAPSNNGTPANIEPTVFSSNGNLNVNNRHMDNLNPVASDSSSKLVLPRPNPRGAKNADYDDGLCSMSVSLRHSESKNNNASNGIETLRGEWSDYCIDNFMDNQEIVVRHKLLNYTEPQFEINMVNFNDKSNCHHMCKNNNADSSEMKKYVIENNSCHQQHLVKRPILKVKHSNCGGLGLLQACSMKLAPSMPRESSQSVMMKPLVNRLPEKDKLDMHEALQLQSNKQDCYHPVPKCTYISKPTSDTFDILSRLRTPKIEYDTYKIIGSKQYRSPQQEYVLANMKLPPHLAEYREFIRRCPNFRVGRYDRLDSANEMLLPAKSSQTLIGSLSPFIYTRNPKSNKYYPLFHQHHNMDVINWALPSSVVSK